MMIDTLQQILEAFNQPQHKHALMVHLPIGISALGVFVLGINTLISGRSATLRWSCVGLYIMGAVLAMLTKESGEAALLNLDTAGMTEQALAQLETHEQMGERIGFILAAMAILTAATAFKGQNSYIRPIILVISLAAGIAATSYVGITAHHGGMLVYEHGVGVPTTTNNLNTPPLPNHSHDTEKPAAQH